MTDVLYGFGYDTNPNVKARLTYGQLLTKPQLLARTTVAHMDPEFRRRILAFIEASPVSTAADGRRYYSLTLGESWRDSSQQGREFLRRHYLDPVGTLVYLGKRYSLLPGMSPLAPPGSSYHESSDLEDESLAADLFGNLAWAAANCARYGLMNFRATGKKPEPWHHQPSEIPTARRAYTRSNLPVFDLPGILSPPPRPEIPTPPPPTTPEPIPTPPTIPTPAGAEPMMKVIEVYAVDLSDGIRKKCAAEFYGLEVQPGAVIPEMEWTGPVDHNSSDALVQRLTFTYDTYKNLGVQHRVLNLEDLQGINLKYGSRGLPKGDWFPWSLSLFRNRVDG